MSATKRDSMDGCGTPEGYEEWSDSLEPINDEDLERMAAQDEEYRRIKDAEASTGRCGTRESW